MKTRPCIIIELEDFNKNIGYGEIWCNFPSDAATYRFNLLNSLYLNNIIGCEFSNPEKLIDKILEKIVNKVDQRIKAVLSFEDVLSVYSKNIDQLNKNKTLELVTFNYYPNNSKNIEIELLFKNDAIIKLETEIIRCKLEDQGEPWNIEKIENDKNN